MPDIELIGTPSATTSLGDMIQSIRAQIPDPTTDPAVDGPPNGFALATLIRWINDGMRVLATSAPVIQDWLAVQSVNQQDLYPLSPYVASVEQLWFDSMPCLRVPEYDVLFVTTFSSRSYYFGPHTIAANPVLSVFPAPNRTGATTTLSADVTATASSIAVTSAMNFRPYGFAQIENEIFTYRALSGNTLSPCLRGQGLTTAATHLSGTTVTELNIFFKCSRLPRAVTAASDPIDIPLGLVPLIELYVLAKVREAEQESQLATAMRGDFQKAVDKLAEKAQFKGLRQGIQVRGTLEPWLYRGRTFIPAFVLALLICQQA